MNERLVVLALLDPLERRPLQTVDDLDELIVGNDGPVFGGKEEVQGEGGIESAETAEKVGTLPAQGVGEKDLRVGVGRVNTKAR